MKNIRDTLVIIPAYNESQTIEEVIVKIKDCLSNIDILVINDGSADATAEIAKKHGAIVVSLPFNIGYGVALQTGYKYAQAKDYNYVLQMDADGQHEPKYLNDLLNVIKEDKADIIIGSRFLGQSNYQTLFIRRLGMIIFGKIASSIIKQKITDPTSGFQAMNRQVLRFLTGEFYPSDYPDTDVIIFLHLAGFRIKEIPVVMYSAANKKSIHAGFKPLYYIFKMFLSILMIFLRKKPYKKGNKL